MPNNLRYDFVLFDLEGTLVDFQWRLEAAVREILPILCDFGIDLAAYGISPGYAGLYNTTRDITAAWEKEKAAGLFARLDRIYDHYDLDALSRWAPYPGTHPLLEKLSGAGYRMGVVSNCGTHAADAVLARFNLAGYFEIILSRNDVTYIKPAPEGLIRALKEMDLPPEKTLFVGDSINDIQAAENVPMPSCFLSCGESLKTGETADIATHQISSLAELADILIS
jgi:HAD superfamily hydrolase (TIGR01549 family)